MHKRNLASYVLAAAFALTQASLSFAEPVKCQRAIAKASSAFAQARAKLESKCEAGVLAGKLPPNTDCLTEQKTQAGLAKASLKLATAIDKACGGDDKVCGAGGDDESLASIGWNLAACQNFENGLCDMPISHCGDVADCLGCIGSAAVDQAIDLYFDQLEPSDPSSQKVLNKCQQAIGLAASGFLSAKSKALLTCWDARMKGKHSNACPAPGDGKAAEAIAKAEAKKIAKICKACGGPDKLCGTPDDSTPTSIGFAASCPDVTVPGGPDCGDIGTVDNLQKLVQCVDCVTEFKVDCMDRSAVPQLASYPTECNPAPPMPVCGNGVPEQGEQCDDGNNTPGDGCTNCTIDPICGNGTIESGETCDDGNALNGDSCPSNCVIASCAPNGTTRVVNVSFAGATTVSSIVVYLEYPEGKVAIPGTGTGAASRVAAIAPNLGTLPGTNDLDYALIEGIVSFSPLTQGNIFKVTFDNCTGQGAPAQAEFPCTVTDTSNVNGDPVPGVTCSATLLP